MHQAIPQGEFNALLRLLGEGRYSELELVARELTMRHSVDGRGWQMQGVSLMVRERNQEALPLLKQASKLMPDNPSIWDNLGVACVRVKDYAEADVCFQRSTLLQPDRLTAWINWSASACAAGEPEAAERYARQALGLNPNLADVWLNLGNALNDLSRFDQAEVAYNRSLALRPNWEEAELSMGALLEQTGRLGAAGAHFSRILSRNPANWKAHANLSRVHSLLGRTDLAVVSCKRALECKPDALETQSSYLYHLLHEDGLDPEVVFAEHCKYGELMEAPFRSEWKNYANDREQGRRLKVGFVSGDLREHAVAFFMEPLLREFDHKALELHVYSNYPEEDEVTARLRSYVDSWLKVFSLSDDQLARRIRADKVDVLIDLSGHTAYNRLSVFARKPAPIQVSWLGYPGTTGLRAIDYRPVYRASVPPGRLDNQFTEKLVYLPYGSSFQPSTEAPEVNPLPALGRGYITFGSLNRPGKLSDSVIRVWSRVLHDVPESKLLIGSVSEAEMVVRLQEQFRRMGIAPERLDLRPRLPLKEYLALHHEIDILLDSFPYSGGTTSFHALWMGLPVLTLAGATLPQRAGCGIMIRAGLPEWVAETEDEYVSKAIDSVADLDALARLRAGMRERLNNNAKRQTGGMARCMEAAFREMWRRWCRSMPPESFEVQL